MPALGCVKNMNKLFHIILCIISGAVISSCIEINGSGYLRLTEEEKSHVKVCTSPLDSVSNDGNLYTVKVEQVKEYVKSKPKVLVYSYLPFCPASQNPAEMKEYCDKNGLDFIVISSVYDGILPIPRTFTFPVFVIDLTPYDTDNYQKYGDEFYSALTNDDSENRQISSCHLFQNGRYVKSFSLGNVHE